MTSNDGQLRIEPSSNRERNRILEALRSQPGRTLVMRGTCGCKLATATATPAGLTFTATPWPAILPLGRSVTVDGQQLSRRETIKHALTDQETGEALETDERHATLAILGTDVDPVDLLVRCKHGDAVLDAHAVEEWHRAGKAPKVRTQMPRRAYAELEPWGAETTRQLITRTIRGDSMTLDEARKWLRWS